MIKYLTTRIASTALIAVASVICLSIGCVYLNGTTEECVTGVLGLIVCVSLISHVLRFIWRPK